MTIDVPIIIGGRVHADMVDAHELSYESGVRVRIPRLTAEHVAEIRDTAAQTDAELAALTSAEIITFLGDVGELWNSGASQTRAFASAHGHRITGFPWVSMDDDYRKVGSYLANRWHLYDQIESDLGDQRILDEWVPMQMSWRRAFPRGQVFHQLVGNIPLTAMYSLYRGVVTKNRNVAKLPTRDPVSAMMMALAMIECDSDHPVCRAMTVGYWPHDDPVGDKLIAASDAAILWGGDQSIVATRTKLAATVPVAAYGPRWSLSVVDLEGCDVADAAMRVVADVASYDQEACLSTQRVFVRGDVAEFAEQLAAAFEAFSTTRPMVTADRDLWARRSLSLLEARYGGSEVTVGPDYAIVVEPGPVTGSTVTPHPLARTVFVHAIDDPDEVAAAIDGRTQAVGVLPYTLAARHRDVWAAAGANRVYESGFARSPREGFAHDGMLGLAPLVRMVTTDRSMDDPGRNGDHVAAERMLLDKFELIAQSRPEWTRHD